MSHILFWVIFTLGKSILIGRVGVGASLNSRITTLNLLEWTLDRAIESEIDDIIITGDVFEESKTASVTNYIIYILAQKVSSTQF